MGYDIIILAGQSNAEGTGRGEAKNAYQEDERILQLYDPQEGGFEKNADGVDVLKIKAPWSFLIEPACERRVGDHIYGNFALSFAREYIKHGLLQEDRKVLIVKAAAGGTGFAKHHWGMGEVLHCRMLDMIEKALTGGDHRIVAFLWHQGEHDAVENAEWDTNKKYTAYRGNLTGLVQDVRSKYNVPSLPFIAGEFVSEWRNKNQETCQAILNATRDVCNLIGNAKIVSAEGLLSNNQKNGDGDDIHFCRESLYELGYRYFQAFRQLIG